MRIRSMRPEWWSDGAFVRVSRDARLLWLQLLTLTDDAGIVPADSFSIRLKAFPGDADIDVEALLDQLVKAELVLQYTVDGVSYLLLRWFADTQSPRKPHYEHPRPEGPLPRHFSLPEIPEASPASPRHVPDEYGTDAEPVRNQYRTGAEPVRNQYRTSTVPPQSGEDRRGSDRIGEERIGSGSGSRVGGSSPGRLINKTRLNSLSEGGEGEEVKSASLRSAGARIDNPPLPPPDNPDPDNDPLAAHPQLLRFYPDLLKRIAEAHPHAQLPAPGTTDGLGRKTLANLVTLDGYPEREVVEVLTWLFQSDDEQPVFWRGRVESVTGLRRTRDGMTKFARIHERWQQRNGHGKQKYDWCEPEYRDDDPFTRDGSA